jgi:flagellar basal-body rod protein FlgB
MDFIFDKNVDLLSRSLDLYLTRHSVISDNIANAETPYFKARKVDFETELQKSLESHDAGFIDRGPATVKPNIYEDPEAEVGQNLNTVDMDREMSELTKNDMKYSAATTAISKKFALLKYAISEGGRD